MDGFIPIGTKENLSLAIEKQTLKILVFIA